MAALMIYLLAISLIANAVVVAGFLRDRKQTERAAQAERAAVWAAQLDYIRERDEREARDRQIWATRIQAPEVAIAQSMRQPKPREGKGWVNPFDDEEFWEHKKRQVEERDAVS